MTTITKRQALDLINRFCTDGRIYHTDIQPLRSYIESTEDQAACEQHSLPQGFPARIMDLLRSVADRKGTVSVGPWQDENGDPLQDDADAAIAWIAAAASPTAPMSGDHQRTFGSKKTDDLKPNYHATPQADHIADARNMVPQSGSQAAEAAIERALAARRYPANSHNAARAGWEAARAMLAAVAAVPPHGEVVGAVHKDTLAIVPSLRHTDGGAKLWPASRAQFDDAYVLVYALSASPAAPQAEAVAYQYQAQDGSWHNFISQKHHDDTKANGRWPIRALYTTPQPDQTSRCLALPEPAFRLKWDGSSSSYKVDKPNIGDTDVYTAEQVNALVSAAADPILWTDGYSLARLLQACGTFSLPVCRRSGDVPLYIRPLTDAARDVVAERQRQITSEGYTPKHDDEHGHGELARAASCYATVSSTKLNRVPSLYEGKTPPPNWPWDSSWWRPGDPRRMLVKAGALILAEIERLDRASCHNGDAA